VRQGPGFGSRFASWCGTIVNGAVRAGKNCVGKFPDWWNRVVNEERARKLGWLLVKKPSPSLWWGMASLSEAPESLLVSPHAPMRLLCLLEQERAAQDNLSRLTLSDALFYLPDDILAKVDRASMAVSLETRAPFLDHRVVEFAWQLPPDLKVRANQGKWLLRQLMYRLYVPREQMDLPKAGFTAPTGRWMRGRLRDWVEDSLTESSLCRDGLLRAGTVRQHWQGVLDGNDRGAWQVWGILMFQGWLKAQSRRD
jgi:asparagine synthase (glutamine-hydrolysing)